MDYNFEYLKGDSVIVKSSNEEAVIIQRKATVTDNGYKIYNKEEYYIKYNKVHSPQKWVGVEDLEFAKVGDEVSVESEYRRLTALIDTYLSKERLNLELVKKYWDEREALGKK